MAEQHSRGGQGQFLLLQRGRIPECSETGNHGKIRETGGLLTTFWAFSISKYWETLEFGEESKELTLVLTLIRKRSNKENIRKPGTWPCVGCLVT